LAANCLIIQLGDRDTRVNKLLTVAHGAKPAT